MTERAERYPVVLMVLTLIIPLACTLQAGEYRSLGEVTRLKPAFDTLISKDARIEVLAQGFTWTEGPVWVPQPEGGYLLFSDIPRNSVFKWDQEKGISLFLCPSGYTGNSFYGGEPGSNGLLLDPQGRLVSCEHGDRRVSVLTKGGGKRTLVDSYQGKRLNSPNDAVYSSKGDLYLTDPPYGLPAQSPSDPLCELGFCGVYRLSPDGTLTLLTKEMTRPNGIGLSPDEKTLYVAQSDPKAAIWKAFPIESDGTLGQSRLLYDATASVGRLPGLPDGMAVDCKGNVFATGPGGVYVFAPDGTLLGQILTGQRTANCTFGGDDGNVLFMAVDMFLCRIQTKTKGMGR